MNKIITLTLIFATALLTINCGGEDEDFSCTSNTLADVNGADLCGTAFISFYQAASQATEEQFRITIEYGIARSSSNSIKIVSRDIEVGKVYTYDVDNGSDDEMIISPTTGATGGELTVESLKGILTVTELDRTQNLISFTYEVSVTYFFGVPPYSLSGTVTDLHFE